MTNSRLEGQAGLARAAGHWRPTAFLHIPEIDPIGAADARPILSALYLWDCWPLQHEDGQTVVHEGKQWWFFLSSPRCGDPEDRHGAARIRLLSLASEGWSDHGDVLDPATSPGNREWAGSAVLASEGGKVSLFFTAAGRRGEAPTFEQRLFVAEGELGAGGPARFGMPCEIVVADNDRYIRANQAKGRPGEVKAFRDPAWFHDPGTGLSHILFTGSAAWSEDPFNGIVGMATYRAGTWTLDDPLIDAVGINNELERPCMVFRNGRYYLFWSTQTHTFSGKAPAGPNGLYGMVAPSLSGPWRALNGNGLVAANPVGNAFQAYSWWVTGEGAVHGFVNYWGMNDPAIATLEDVPKDSFAGTPAPVFKLCFDGDRVTIAR